MPAPAALCGHATPPGRSRSRGLCAACYGRLHARVRAGRATWAQLQAEGACLAATYTPGDSSRLPLGPRRKMPPASKDTSPGSALHQSGSAVIAAAIVWLDAMDEGADGIDLDCVVAALCKATRSYLRLRGPVPHVPAQKAGGRELTGNDLQERRLQ